MGETDQEYYRRRAVRQREAALKASDRTVKAVHFTLAIEYDALVEGRSTLVPPLR